MLGKRWGVGISGPRVRLCNQTLPQTQGMTVSLSVELTFSDYDD